MDMGVPSTTINYTYEVVNGLVTDMQVVVQQQLQIKDIVVDGESVN